MKISIITIVYNREKTIEDTIISVLNQTYKNVEYIVVDGASTDNTLKIVNKYKDKISKIISEPDKLSFSYINAPLVKMRLGGISTSGLKQRLKCNTEAVKALKENGIKANHLTILKKYPTKIKELILGKIYNLTSKKKEN
ncbi:glycosyltransferase [Aliarcobacter cryaerophilus]|uniref:glycosyltransferase n=1 Tax=Aliarcobacter cryaerophilus TaxID=28198 RepID=UPI003DA40F60